MTEGVGDGVEPQAGKLKRVRVRRKPGYRKPGQRKGGKKSQSSTNRKRRLSYRRRSPTRLYHAPEMMEMAYLAGRGWSGEEIAQKIGGTTGPKVRAVLRKFHLRMVRSSWREAVFQIVCRVSVQEKLVAIADARDIELDVMLVDLLERLDEEDINTVLDRPDE